MTLCWFLISQNTIQRPHHGFQKLYDLISHHLSDLISYSLLVHCASGVVISLQLTKQASAFSFIFNFSSAWNILPDVHMTLFLTSSAFCRLVTLSKRPSLINSSKMINYLFCSTPLSIPLTYFILFIWRRGGQRDREDLK